jgi:hypothetical protein
MLFKEQGKKRVLKIDLEPRSCLTSRHSDFTDLHTARMERKLSRQARHELSLDTKSWMSDEYFKGVTLLKPVGGPMTDLQAVRNQAKMQKQFNSISLTSREGILSSTQKVT